MNKENTIFNLEDKVLDESKTALDVLLCKGAQQILQLAIENEVEEYIERNKTEKDENGPRLVTRNGSMPE